MNGILLQWWDWLSLGQLTGYGSVWTMLVASKKIKGFDILSCIVQLDGYVARKMRINSVVGSYLDPLADKVNDKVDPFSLPSVIFHTKL